MDQKVFIGIIAAIMVLMLIKMVITHYKQRRIRQEFVTEGTHFEAKIIGVAHPKRRLNIEGQPPPQTINILGTEWTDVSDAARAEDHGHIRVKISFIHPVTKQQTIVHRTLLRSDYVDDRLTRAGNPGTISVSSKSMDYLKWNKKLYDTYVKDVKSRKLSKEEEKKLIREAILAMNNPNEEWTLDSEGYSILNPPVIAEGYYLNDKLEFSQKTNTPIYTDWTKGLK